MSDNFESCYIFYLFLPYPGREEILLFFFTVAVSSSKLGDCFIPFLKMFNFVYNLLAHLYHWINAYIDPCFRCVHVDWIQTISYRLL